MGVCITAGSILCRLGRGNDRGIHGSLLDRRGDRTDRATEAGIRGSLDGTVGGEASSTSGDGPRATG